MAARGVAGLTAAAEEDMSDVDCSDTRVACARGECYARRGYCTLVRHQMNLGFRPLLQQDPMLLHGSVT